MANGKSTVKTDNSFLADKVGLRVAHLPAPAKGDITVLDCFAGNGRIWRAVKRRTNREIKILGMDKRNNVIGFHLPGDNTAWLMGMDLSRFNVIDLDAYGVPYDQLNILFERGYKGTVFVTFIQSIWGRMPKQLLIDVGFTEAMMEKALIYLTQKVLRDILNTENTKGHKTCNQRHSKRQSYISPISKTLLISSLTFVGLRA